MDALKTKMDHAGRILIPARLRKILGLHPGDAVLLIPEDRSVRLLSVEERIRRAQDLTKTYVASDRSLAEELVRDRREAAKHE